jgi:hypothetical protein
MVPALGGMSTAKRAVAVRIATPIIELRRAPAGQTVGWFSGVALTKPLSRATLRSIQDAGLFAMWRNPSGLFAQNRFGSIVVEPESPAGGDLKASSQLFASVVRNRPEFGPIIPSKTLEQMYRDMLVRYINFLSTHLRIEPPLVIKAGAVGLKGFRLAVDADLLFGPFYDDAFEKTNELKNFSPEAINAVLLAFFEALFAASAEGGRSSRPEHDEAL